MKSSASINISNSRILVVDDDPVVRQLLKRVLQRSQFHVDAVASGEAALEFVSSEVSPDLVLLDIVMGGIDGFETCRKLREMSVMDEVPILMVSARSDTKSLVEGLEAGATDHISKPINRHEALARIQNHLRMRVLLRQQREYSEGLRETSFAKGRIIGVVSHDLKNPLISIRGLSELLAEMEPLTVDQKRLLKTIHTTSQTVLDMVDSLLDLSIIESTKEEAVLKPCVVDELLFSSMHIYKFAGNRKSINVELVDQGMPHQLLLDRLQFRRLVDNLLSNAVKYSPHGSNVHLITQMEGDIFRIIVEDEGPGVPEESKDSIFREFVTASIQPTGGETSNGLGLSICKNIVEAHFGKIWVENRDGGVGSRFIVELDTSKLSIKN